jgi:branched-chain amino acid aminotransferase
VTGTSIVWLNGSLVDATEAPISPFDHGLMVGDGVFETCKVIDGVAFALRRHLERLARSAAGLGLPLPSPDDLRAAADATIAANGEGVGRLRITVTGGSGPLGSGRGDGPPTVLVTTGPSAQWPPDTAVITVPWPRNERAATAGLKTTSYADNVVALARANECGAGEAIFPNTRGELCEGTGTNVFVGMGGRLLTPPLSSGCLAGITRELLLEITGAEEVALPVDELARADEAFLTSSTREVQPISSVDGRSLASHPGPLTSAAADAFAALVARTLDP